MSIEFNNKLNNDIAAQKNQDGTTGAGAKNDTDKTLFTRQQFTNSIMNALGKTKLDDSQVSQFKSEATSIFSTYDNSPQDNKWSQTEANSGGANALSAFYNKVNNAIKQVTSAVNVNKAQDVSNTSEVSKTNETNNVQDNNNNDIKSLINEYKGLFSEYNCQVTGETTDAQGNITLQIKNTNGQEGFVKLNSNGELIDYDEEVVGNVKKQADAYQDKIEDQAISPLINFSIKFLNASKEEQTKMLQDMLKEFQADGNKITSFDGTNITFTNSQGKTDKITIQELFGLQN